MFVTFTSFRRPRLLIWRIAVLFKNSHTFKMSEIHFQELPNASLLPRPLFFSVITSPFVSELLPLICTFNFREILQFFFSNWNVIKFNWFHFRVTYNFTFLVCGMKFQPLEEQDLLCSTCKSFNLQGIKVLLLLPAVQTWYETLLWYLVHFLHHSSDDL